MEAGTRTEVYSSTTNELTTLIGRPHKQTPNITNTVQLLITKSWRTGTEKGYNSKIKFWIRYCR